MLTLSYLPNIDAYIVEEEDYLVFSSTFLHEEPSASIAYITGWSIQLVEDIKMAIRFQDTFTFDPDAYKEQ